MNISQLRKSRYLSQGDVDKGALLTVKSVTHEDVSMEDEPEKLRWVMYFEEVEKGLVLNSTNGQIIARFLKSDESNDWIGQKIVLFADPTISFGGRVVGGIRVRAPRNQPSKPIFKAPSSSARPMEDRPVPTTEELADTRAADQDGDNVGF